MMSRKLRPQKNYRNVHYPTYKEGINRRGFFLRLGAAAGMLAVSGGITFKGRKAKSSNVDAKYRKLDEQTYEVFLPENPKTLDVRFDNGGHTDGEVGFTTIHYQLIVVTGAWEATSYLVDHSLMLLDGVEQRLVAHPLSELESESSRAVLEKQLKIWLETEYVKKTNRAAGEIRSLKLVIENAPLASPGIVASAGCSCNM